MVFVMVATMVPYTAFAGEASNTKANQVEFSGGTGTETDPYLLSTKEDLNNVRNYLSSYFKMTNDISFISTDFGPDGDFFNDGEGWIAIGNSAEKVFTGVFDGNGFTIENLAISTSREYIGLFGISSGDISNLTLEGLSLKRTTGNGGSKSNVGGIVGSNSGSITNCHVEGDFFFMGMTYGGGVSGKNTGAIKVCSFDGTMNESSGTSFYGGVVGDNSGSIENSFNKGTIAGGYEDFVGGMVARNNAGTIKDCYNQGRVASDNGGMGGGIVAFNDGGIVDRCYNKGGVSSNGSKAIGGIAGENSSAPSSAIVNCYNQGEVFSRTPGKIGGIVGENSQKVENCYNEGNVYSEKNNKNKETYYGGIAGDNSGSISSCYNKGNVKGTTTTSTGGELAYVGGISANNNGAVSQCYNLGRITSETTSAGSGDSDSSQYHAYAGGVVGYNNGKTIDNCFNAGDISAISKADTSGSRSYAGGLVGYGIGGKLMDSYNIGSIEAKSSQVKYAGGLIGYGGDGNKPTIEDCFYYDNSCAGGKETVLGVKLSFDDLKDVQKYTGLDFGSVWEIKGDGNYRLPTLQFVTLDDSSEMQISIPEKISLSIGTEKTIEPVIVGNPFTKVIKWKSGDESIAKIDKNGKLTGIAAGSTTVEGTTLYGNKVISAVVEVKIDLTGGEPLEVKLSGTNFIYDGTAKKPAVEIDGLEQDIDYTVSYSGNVSAGNGKVVITGKGDYTGTITKTFSISPVSSGKCTASLTATKYAYDGKLKIPTVIVKGINGKTLAKGTDYQISGSTSKSSVGLYKITVTFKGNYTGSKTLSYSIVPKAPYSVAASLHTYSGGYDDVKFSWSKCTGASGYNVYYKRSTSKSYTYLTATTGTSVTKKNLTDGVKYYFKVIPYFKSGTTKYYSTLQYKVASTTTLKKVELSGASRSGSKVKVRWRNINGESGYQISRSSKKSGTYIVYTYKTTAGTYKTVSATKGKYYYYKVRAYRQVGSKKVYGPWSAVKGYRR